MKTILIGGAVVIGFVLVFYFLDDIKDAIATFGGDDELRAIEEAAPPDKRAIIDEMNRELDHLMGILLADCAKGRGPIKTKHCRNRVRRRIMRLKIRGARAILRAARSELGVRQPGEAIADVVGSVAPAVAGALTGGSLESLAAASGESDADDFAAA